MGREYFHFDRVFGPESKTEEIYSEAVLPMVINALRGYNVAILAYGQTSSGKTYTICGGSAS